MNSRTPWLLLGLAALLGGFILVWEKHVAGPARQPPVLLPGFDPRAIQTIQVRAAGQPELLAARTNGGWQLTRPLPHPAQAQRVEGFLDALRTARPTARFTAAELAAQPDWERAFGFTEPLATVDLFSERGRRQILFGARTPPGDHVYVEVIGRPGVLLLSAALFEAVPTTPGAWRDTALLDWAHLTFDRITVASGTRTTELQRDGPQGAWRLPRLQARADSPLIEELLQRLRATPIQEFIADGPDLDLEAYGLRTPELTLNFLHGTNSLVRLHLGRSPTNAPALLFARRSGLASVFTVPAEPFAPWRAPAAEFRDRQLVRLAAVPRELEVVADDTFRVRPDSNGVWRVEPAGWVADTNYLADVLVTLGRMQIVAFEKDVVTGPDLPRFGLDPPFRQFILHGAQPDPAAPLHLAFGTNTADRMLVKRSDEDSVYAVLTAEFNKLPAASWELRDRHVWSFPMDELVRVSVEKGGRRRDLLRQGSNSWSLAEGSLGAINVFGVEETAARLADLRAAWWVLPRPDNLADFGFNEPAYRVILLTRDGQRREVRFGGTAPNQFPFAVVPVAGEPWLCEFPWDVFQFVETYLAPPVP